MRQKWLLILTGIIVGGLSILLVAQGNPANMGFCIACFLRDIAGGLGLHRAGVVQYIRPEIIGLILGAFIMALFTRDFKSTGGSGPVLRFLLGALMMIGSLIFLGCPLRMILRLAGGDWNALVALPGYIVGIWAGTLFLKGGYTLGRSNQQSLANGSVGLLIALGLLVLVLVRPVFIFFSTEGPGSMHAPLLVALGAGLLVGILAQRSRLCTMGAIRDIILFRDFHLFSGFAAIFGAALIGNLLLHKFNPGFVGQPVAHNDAFWNFASMAVLGLAAVFAGGCPLRQLILAGEGNGDALITVLGLVAGAAFMHNFGLASSPTGVTEHGKIAVIIALALLIIIGLAGLGAAKLKTGYAKDD
ncbi:MAG: YedE family putative selenium transporter [Dethiobacteria bacterium]|jgi:YedE family putative selenium metabolism protein